MKKFLSSLSTAAPLHILDVGSRKANRGPTYRALIPKDWQYIGLDLVIGPNVDVIAEQPYSYPFPDDCFDVVISGQVLEHVEDPRLYIWEIHRVCSGGGKVCIIAPSSGPIHCRPDYRRILPDGMQSLLEYAGFKNIEVTLGKVAPWCDCVGKAQK